MRMLTTSTTTSMSAPKTSVARSTAVTPALRAPLLGCAARCTSHTLATSSSISLHTAFARQARPNIRILDTRAHATAVDTPISSSRQPSTSSTSSTTTFDLACPICHQTTFQLSNVPTRSEGLCCPRCARTFTSGPQYVDLTLTSGLQPEVYKQRAWGGTELFRSPLVSFVYERGWRQGFAWAGFPGVDKETDLALAYLAPAEGKVVVDMSCGSGLFSRKFANSGKFSGVIAADFSESMLGQAKTFLANSAAGAGQAPVLLLRADVGRLPFATGAVAAIHAGAAIHCWPNPQAALAEISRVLAPGGVFVASTFLTAAAPLGAVLGDNLVRPLNRLDGTANLTNSNYRWWEEAELRDLCSGVGLQDFTRTREWRFIMFAARKPQKPAE